MFKEEADALSALVVFGEGEDVVTWEDPDIEFDF